MQIPVYYELNLSPISHSKVFAQDQSDAVKFLPVYFMKQNDLGKKQIDLGRKQIDCRKQTDLG